MSDYTAVYTLNPATASRNANQAPVIVWYTANDASPTLTYNGNGSDPGTVSRKDDGSGKPKKLQVSASASIDVQVLLAGSSTPCTMVGVVLRNSGNSGNAQGLDTFTSVAVSGATLTLADTDSAGNNTYEFDLMFSDGSGTYGLLDPKIQNT
jgi:hypothetical protein